MPDGIKIRQLDENTEPVDSDVFVIDSENPNFPDGTSDVSYTRKVSYSTLKTQLESDLDIQAESGDTDYLIFDKGRSLFLEFDSELRPPSDDNPWWNNLLLGKMMISDQIKFTG